MTPRLLIFCAFVVLGCAQHPARSRLYAYADAGPLKVRGAPWSAPGPSLVRALRDDPSAQRVLAANGEPDTIEVVSGRGVGDRFVLTYPSGRSARPRRVVIEPPSRAAPDRRRAHATRTVSARTSPAPRARRAPGAPNGTPTAHQALECPIDPGRADCRALCATSATYEWCR
jgi:hypothetical protein